MNKNRDKKDNPEIRMILVDSAENLYFHQTTAGKKNQENTDNINYA